MFRRHFTTPCTEVILVRHFPENYISLRLLFPKYSFFENNKIIHPFHSKPITFNLKDFDVFNILKHLSILDILENRQV